MSEEQTEHSLLDDKAMVSEWRQRLAAGEEPTREEIRKVLATIRTRRTIPISAKEKPTKAASAARTPEQLKMLFAQTLKGSN
jgi:hypothetical protein